MTPKLQSALDALNACASADDVAALLRRHAVKSLEKKSTTTEPWACVCPLAAYFIRIGGADGPAVGITSVWLDGLTFNLSAGPQGFIRKLDLYTDAYPDLEAA